MKSRFVCLALALVLLFSAAACSSGDKSGDSSGGQTAAATSDSVVQTEPETTIDPALLPPEFPAKDYKGGAFTFMQILHGYGIYNHEKYVPEEESGELLNDAMYARNRKVEELFNVKFAEEDVTGSTIANRVKTFVTSGDNAIDVYFSVGNPTLGPEFCYDYTEMPGINLDRAWWDQNYMQSNSVNGKLCTIVSSMQITQIDSCFAMLFNKKIATDHKISDKEIYQLVHDGKWTLDKFLGYCKAVTTDLDGNGVYDEKDLYGATALDGMMRLGTGTPLYGTKKDSKDIPSHNLDDAAFINKLTKLTELGEQFKTEIQDSRAGSDIPSNGVIFDIFIQDKALFYVHGFGSVNKFREMDSDFGVIPTPKFDESQEDYSIWMDNSGNKYMMVNATTADAERVGLVMEALSYYGHTDVIPQYYEALLQSKYMRDRDSVDMMNEYILPNLFYYPCFGSTTLFSNTEKILKGTMPLASTIAANKETIAKEIADYTALFTK